jgi:hypothetical protein
MLHCRTSSYTSPLNCRGGLGRIRPASPGLGQMRPNQFPGQLDHRGHVAEGDLAPSGREPRRFAARRQHGRAWFSARSERPVCEFGGQRVQGDTVLLSAREPPNAPDRVFEHKARDDRDLVSPNIAEPSLPAPRKPTSGLGCQ